ncbi:uncharacterized protein LY79DRAFT_667153 [Colletotrichum navitas]|uniref:Uncharacterized protein n=1 Tax=Colletotrichum navitas TaxID=681940 RepID=A0AAD8V6Y3_9PEZI|nr:uncharacterized protein LY79DRAFT_667153 [Colletotrichum navitas]KAK1596552.1 hypothetical protein LY79DRAFT_667153 [Colletotrichum navitas]
MAAVYTGPSVADMLANRTLAKEIIARNSDPEPILDADELALLEQFVNDPNRANAILESKGLAADPKNSGSLVAYVISLHATDSPALSAEDISSLKAWYMNNAGEEA